MEQVLNELHQLKDDVEKSKNEKKISDKRSELVSKLKDKKIDDSKWINAYLKKLPINADTDIDKEVDDALEFYNISNSHFGKEATPHGVGGRIKEDEHQNDDVKAILKRNRGINE